MSEYRQDGATGAWVIIAPTRGARPMAWRQVEAHGDWPAVYDPSCPFCPGNERLLPPIIAETPMENAPGWRVRVVNNKYPALYPDGDPKPAAIGLQTQLPGFGYHDVIVESPRHDADLTTLSDAEIGAVVVSYRTCFNALAMRPHITSVFVFRNHGSNSGASLVHPHSQVIATAIVPPKTAETARWARERHAATGCCATCSDLNCEMDDGRRIIEASAHFLAFVPFAATGPFELRIAPRRHLASFGLAGDIELMDFAAVLRRTLTRLALALDDPSYNFVIESVAASSADAQSLHWCLKILPKLTTPAGFELASGIRINPSLPETDAEMLRAIELGR
ncbi:MAG: galactose-1-phosphate uridylyltransferase [Methylovirgula sp.]